MPFYILIAFIVALPLESVSIARGGHYDFKNAEASIGLSKDAFIASGVKYQQLKWHVFRGITLFGSETLQVYQVSRKEYREVVVFRNERIVSIETRYETPDINIKEKILKPALLHYGVRNCVKYYYKSRSVNVNSWLLKGRKSISVVTSGQFKDEIAPKWTKVRVFDRKFFHFRNQHKFWPNDYGSERLILR